MLTSLVPSAYLRTLTTPWPKPGGAAAPAAIDGTLLAPTGGACRPAPPGTPPPCDAAMSAGSIASRPPPPPPLLTLPPLPPLPVTLAEPFRSPAPPGAGGGPAG